MPRQTGPSGGLRTPTARAIVEGVLDPIVTTAGIDVSPLHVIAVVLVAGLIGLIGIGIRRFLMASADELADLTREVGGHVTRAALDRRAMPTPWFCDRCRSRNGEAVTRCYSCGAQRATAEAPVPDAVAPAGPSAGRSQRTRTGH